MAGCWPSSFLACLWTETKHAKKERGQYRAILTEQAWSMKDLLYDLKHQKMIFKLAGPSEKSRAGKIASYLPPSGSQSQLAIWFILLAHGASHIVICENLVYQQS